MSTRRAFSLVELLAVIGVLSILAAILLPVLEHSVETARITQCAANQRNLALGLLMYANDNANSYPARIASADYAAYRWSKADGGVNNFSHRAMIEPYVPPSEAIECPLLSGKRLAAVDFWTPSGTWKTWTNAAGAGWPGYNCYAWFESVWYIYTDNGLTRSAWQGDASSMYWTKVFPKRVGQFPDCPIVSDRVMATYMGSGILTSHMDQEGAAAQGASSIAATLPALGKMTAVNFAYPDGSVITSAAPDRMTRVNSESIYYAIYWQKR